MGPGHRDDRVADDELLYRRVLAEDMPLVEGGCRISSQAFTARDKEPSVDRAVLRNHCPELTQEDPSFGVISVRAGQVRSITLRVRSASGQDEEVHPFDVRPKPTEQNPAHAEIFIAHPSFQSRSGFEKLLKELKRFAQIELHPDREE